MSRTTGRTMQLLGLLQSGRDWSGAELCSRLEVSDRTLRRDVDDLRDLGYGIEATRGVGGGYRLGPGAAIPPLTLSPDEAVAIAVGLRAAALGAVTGLEDSAASALAKLEQSLSAETRARVETVERAMVPLSSGPVGAVDVNVVVTIARAIRESRQVHVEYARRDGDVTRRTIEPHRIVHTNDRWYLVAWDVDRLDWRTLRVDRLVPTLPLGARFRPREIPIEELQRYTTESIAVKPWNYRATLRVQAPAEAVRDRFGATLARVEAVDDAHCLLHVGAQSWEELAIYVVLSGFEFVVVQPEELRESMKVLSERLARASR